MLEEVRANPLLFAAKRGAGLLARWHRAELDGVEHLPRGPALLVGNHGLYGLETPVFFWLLLRETGRLPCGLADRTLFGNRLVRPLLARVGSAPATAQDALRQLAAGHLVVCYPGGAFETFKEPDERYRLHWERNCGFARLAIAARVPIVPFAGLGVDDVWINLGHLRAARRLFGRYSVPLGVGLGPLPFPARLRFVLDRPLEPPQDAREAASLKRAVESVVRSLLDSRGSHVPVPARPARAVS